MIVWLLLACGATERGGNECSAEVACDWGQTCIEGFCTSGACATSAQCPVDQFCSEGQCATGCRQDPDCAPGSHCDLLLLECAPDACQDTQVDCGFREYCDTTTGSCYDAGDTFCRPCERDVDCGAGNVCWQDHCGVDCSTTPCPSGFDCLALRRGSTGDITAYQCLTPCGLYP